MALDLSSAALLNAAGSAFLFLVGLIILALGGRNRRTMLVGALAATIGILYILQNLVRATTPEGAAARLWSHAALAFLSAAIAVALCVNLARDATRSDRRALSGFAVAAALITVVGGGLFFAIARADESPTALVGAMRAASYTFANPFAVAAVVAASLRTAAAPEMSRPHRRAWLLLALALGIWVVFAGITTGAAAIHLAGLRNWLAWVEIARAALITGLLMMFAPNPREPRLGRVAMLVFATVGAIALTAVLVNERAATGNAWGLFGILRTIGAALLLVAVAKYDLLGVTLPKLAANRGALAATALAALLITAEIAQNFLSAEYGILLGGVIAGVFLFAAAPLQRALEGRGWAHRHKVDEPPGSESRRETAYLDACRLAMRDKRLTRDEESRLHGLADEMGLAPSRAHALLVQAETEHALGAASPKDATQAEDDARAA